MDKFKEAYESIVMYEKINHGQSFHKIDAKHMQTIKEALCEAYNVKQGLNVKLSPVN